MEFLCGALKDKQTGEFEYCHDRCEVVMQWVQSLMVEGERKGLFKIAPPILSRTYQQLGNGIVNLNNARKITDFPIPFPLAQMIAFMLFFHWIVTPLVCATVVASLSWAGILSFVVSASYWSVNYIACELEQPFGDDANDLPLREMQEDFNLSLRSIMQKHGRSIPCYVYEEGHEMLLASNMDFEEFSWPEQGDKDGCVETAGEAQQAPSGAVLTRAGGSRRAAGEAGPSSTGASNSAGGGLQLRAAADKRGPGTRQRGSDPPEAS